VVKQRILRIILSYCRQQYVNVAFQNMPVVFYQFIKGIRSLKIWIIKLNIQFKLKDITCYFLVHYKKAKRKYHPLSHFL
jgi:hypothetical protein